MKTMRTLDEITDKWHRKQKSDDLIVEYAIRQACLEYAESQTERLTASLIKAQKDCSDLNSRIGEVNIIRSSVVGERDALTTKIAELEGKLAKLTPDWSEQLEDQKHQTQVFMAQVRKLQKELASEKQRADALEVDKARLDWCERNLICLNDGGGVWGIDFGSVAEPTTLDYLPCVREAIDAAMTLKGGEDLELSKQESMAIRHSVVSTIGGTVEGHPTSEINYLQRLRQLVQAEKDCALLSDAIYAIVGSEMAIAHGESVENFHKAMRDGMDLARKHSPGANFDCETRRSN